MRESTLGPSGGYRLARAPSQISFLDIVEAVEGKGPVFVCTEIRGNNPCRPAGFCDERPCVVARVMWDAENAWRGKLRAVSLADLAETVKTEIPADIGLATDAWVQARL